MDALLAAAAPPSLFETARRGGIRATVAIRGRGQPRASAWPMRCHGGFGRSSRTFP